MINPAYTPESMVDALLDRHDQIAIVVLPRKCLGLGQFPDDPLRLNVGHALSPAMAIAIDSKCLEFTALFGRTPQRVTVPWGALLFAGTEAALSKVLTAALEPEPAPVAEREGNVVRVDFGRKEKSPGALRGERSQ